MELRISCRSRTCQSEHESEVAGKGVAREAGKAGSLDLDNRLVDDFQVDLQFDFALVVDEAASLVEQREHFDEIGEADRR